MPTTLLNLKLTFIYKKKTQALKCPPKTLKNPLYVVYIQIDFDNNWVITLKKEKETCCLRGYDIRYMKEE